MKKITFIVSLLIALIYTSSCTIKQTINYNEDMSGDCALTFDYGDFMNQMGDLMGDSTEDTNLDLQEGLGKLDEEFRDIKGITNIKSIENLEDHNIGFSFDFTDTKALNKAMSSYLGDEEENKKVTKSYIQKRKKLILNFDEQTLSDAFAESAGDESLTMMLDMFEYEIEINLPKAVKSIDNDNYTLSLDRKTIKTKVNLGEYFAGEVPLSAKIKW